MKRELKSLTRLAAVLSSSCVFLITGASEAPAIGRKGPAPGSPSDPPATVASLVGAIGDLAEPRTLSRPPRPLPLFVRPLAGAVTSPFGWRHGREHTGVDFDGDTGEPVVAAAAGTIVHAGSYFGYGETVMIDHGSGFGTLYGHLSGIEVALGRQVKQGQRVGLVGCSGACTGDHLHFEIRIDSEPVDPLPFLRMARMDLAQPVMRAPMGGAVFGPSAP